jgi:hypothetical protein
MAEDENDLLHNCCKWLRGDVTNICPASVPAGARCTFEEADGCPGWNISVVDAPMERAWKRVNTRTLKALNDIDTDTFFDTGDHTFGNRSGGSDILRK